ncbi:hypothetical protein JOC70_000253 [Clostridium pascui]|uniref:hypothetical protein n=1 Tax=Clostridium pascui TaxID=46609 RepID=UPI00195D82A4|nr:hypothetical protein [Clostridium pascui]MBM7868784.1 hypothetical protein [Clostridium pascui]
MNTRKKVMVVSIFSMVIALFSPLIYQNIQLASKSITIPKPKKVVVYNNGKNKAIYEGNKNFDKILKLICERINSTDSLKKVSNSENKNLLLDEVNQAKNSWRCIELVYDNPTSFKLNLNNDAEEQVKIKKAFFLISAEATLDFGIDMIYGEDEYTSRLVSIKTEDKIMLSLLRIIEQELL